jgi:outer membrane lipoprotein LolB
MKNTIILLLCLLTGCASFSSPKPETSTPSLSWSQRQAQLQKIVHWRAEGMMSIRSTRQTSAFSFEWLQQNQENYALEFFAPLGLGSVRVLGNASNVVLWQSATQKITAKTPEALMIRQLGYSVPVTSLYYWIRGLPDPHLPMSARFDVNHHLSTLQQQGWKINFQNFKTISGVDLPTMILLSYEQDSNPLRLQHPPISGRKLKPKLFENESMQVKIVITRWNIL